uniref:Uncharacterized protein n=1 Tax=Haplochromis burtoni TaxID=8153 RepID=A0A3Q3CXI9_HAPBU
MEKDLALSGGSLSPHHFHSVDIFFIYAVFYLYISMFFFSFCWLLAHSLLQRPSKLGTAINLPKSGQPNRITPRAHQQLTQEVTKELQHLKNSRPHLPQSKLSLE